MNRRDLIAQESVTTLPRKPKLTREIMAGATGLEPATFGVTGQQFNLNIQDAFQLLKRGNEPKHPDQLERAARLTSSESKEPWGAGGQRRQGSRPTAVFVRAAAVGD